MTVIKRTVTTKTSIKTTTTRTTMMSRVSQIWDLMETWGYQEASKISRALTTMTITKTRMPTRT